jgi:hypothetical protein
MYKTDEIALVLSHALNGSMHKSIEINNYVWNQSVRKQTCLRRNLDICSWSLSLINEYSVGKRFSEWIVVDCRSIFEDDEATRSLCCERYRFNCIGSIEKENLTEKEKDKKNHLPGVEG